MSEERGRAPSGSLTLVGTGIAADAHLTPETRAALESADEVFYVVADPAAAAALERLNPNSRSLFELYREGVVRAEIYAEMAAIVVASAREGKRVCAAFYGHPGVLVRPAHEAMRLARREGIEARMLPAVSGLDCLFADLGVEPADPGLHAYEATQFLTRGRRPDPTVALVLWQLHLIGKRIWGETGADGLEVLAEYLLRWYPRQHEIVIYEASSAPGVPATMQRLPVSELAQRRPPFQASLYVPPAEQAPPDPEMVERLGLPLDDVNLGPASGRSSRA